MNEYDDKMWQYKAKNNALSLDHKLPIAAVNASGRCIPQTQ